MSEPANTFSGREAALVQCARPRSTGLTSAIILSTVEAASRYRLHSEITERRAGFRWRTAWCGGSSSMCDKSMLCQPPSRRGFEANCRVWGSILRKPGLPSLSRGASLQKCLTSLGCRWRLNASVPRCVPIVRASQVVSEKIARICSRHALEPPSSSHIRGRPIRMRAANWQ